MHRLNLFSMMLFLAIITQSDGLLRFMSKVYGKQTVMVSLVLGINCVIILIFCCVTCGGLGCRVSLIWDVKGMQADANGNLVRHSLSLLTIFMNIFTTGPTTS